MNVEIKSFADAGDYQKERLVIAIRKDTDIGDFAVLCSPVSDGSPTSGGKSAYWFPDRDVKAGDLVVLYTKRGKPRAKDIGEGRTAYFFYWAQENAIWGSAGNAAVVLAVDDFIYKTPA